MSPGFVSVPGCFPVRTGSGRGEDPRFGRTARAASGESLWCSTGDRDFSWAVPAPQHPAEPPHLWSGLGWGLRRVAVAARGAAWCRGSGRWRVGAPRAVLGAHPGCRPRAVPRDIGHGCPRGEAPAPISSHSNEPGGCFSMERPLLPPPGDLQGHPSVPQPFQGQEGKWGAAYSPSQASCRVPAGRGYPVLEELLGFWSGEAEKSSQK